MTKLAINLLSLVVPLYNEANGLKDFNKSLQTAIKKSGAKNYEIIYCDDGSSDGTAELVHGFHAANPEVKLVRLSRNFGKENALAAGIAQATGDIIVTLDGDGQHPPELIPEFISAWKSGAQVVIGLSSNSKHDSQFNSLSSKLFYRLFNSLASEKLLPASTDYRLITRQVQQAFLGLTESDRMTRALIDWLGFKRSYIRFETAARRQGSKAYNRRKLMRLAANTFVSMSPKPLYFFGYLGIFITLGSLLLGGSVFIEQILLGDPWHWKFTGTAMLGILLLFLVGILLMAQGMLSLYVSHIHSQSKSRPLYVIDYEESAGVRKV